MEAEDWLAIICFALEGICFIWFITTLILQFIIVRKIVQDDRKNLIKSYDAKSVLILSSYHSRGNSLININNLSRKLSNVSLNSEDTLNTVRIIDNRYLISTIIKFIIAFIILFGACLMCTNKLYYKFWGNNILFINANNFVYFNNIHKVLNILTLSTMFQLIHK